MAKQKSTAAPQKRLIVAVAGPQDALTKLLVQRLEQQNQVAHVICLGLSTPALGTDKVQSIRIRFKPPFEEDMQRLFTANKVNALVLRPLAPSLRYSAQDNYQYYLHNAVAPMGLFRAALAAGLDKIVVISSTRVYGLRATNPCFITEERFPAAEQQFPYLHALVQLDSQVSAFLLPQPLKPATVLLRPAPLLGPGVESTFKQLLYTIPGAPVLLGFDPQIQLLHAADLISGIWLALTKKVSGIFNLVAPGFVSWQEAIEIAGATKLPTVAPLLCKLVDLLWRFERLPLPPAELRFLRYPLVADGSKARQVLGFAPQYTTAQTIAAVTAKLQAAP